MAADKKRKADGKDKSSQSEKKSRQEEFSSKESLFFHGQNIFVSDSGMGKTRADLFRKQLKKYGADAPTTFSENVSYVVIDDSVSIERVCEMFTQKLDDQNDDSKFKIVRTSWLSSCLKEKSFVNHETYEVDWKSHLKTVQSNNHEHNESNTQPKCDEKRDKASERPSLYPKVGVMWRAMPKKKAEGEEADSDAGSDYAGSGGRASPISSNDDEPQPSTSRRLVPQDKWICAQSSANKSGNVNEHITKKLQELATIYENTKDTWRALGYQKAIAALRRHPKPITSFEEAKALRGVGARLAEKIWEIVESGELRKLDELSSDEDMKTLDMFAKLWGAGPTTASAWVRAGFRTLDDLRTKANLTRQQKIGLKYYNELLDRMPREEAAQIEAKVKEAAAKVNPGLICMACGSYRRGRATCGDVDVLVTHPDGKSHKGIFSKILNLLRESGFLTDDLVTQEETGNQKKYLGVCILPGENQKHRRLDIIVVPYDEYACALMYFTGSAHFNRSMRHLAGKMGMSLSEHSLNKGVVKVHGEKVNKGTPLYTPTEESVFEHLGLKYRPPIDRDHK